MPDGVLKSSRAIMRLRRGSALGPVLQFLNSVHHTRGCFGYEGAAISALRDKMPGNVTELRRKIPMDEQDVHKGLSSREGASRFLRREMELMQTRCLPQERNPVCKVRA